MPPITFYQSIVFEIVFLIIRDGDLDFAMQMCIVNCIQITSRFYILFICKSSGLDKQKIHRAVAIINLLCWLCTTGFVHWKESFAVDKKIGILIGLLICFCDSQRNFTVCFVIMQKNLVNALCTQAFVVYNSQQTENFTLPIFVLAKNSNCVQCIRCYKHIAKQRLAKLIRGHSTGSR